MVHFLSALGKLLSAAPTLLSGSALSRQQELGARPKSWCEALHTLYDGVLNEPVPRRLVEMVRRHARSRKG
jgi:hypothetical protein